MMIRPFGTKTGEGISSPIDKERAKKVAVIGGLAVAGAVGLMLAEKVGLVGSGNSFQAQSASGDTKLTVTALPAAIRAGENVGIAVKLTAATPLPDSQIIVKLNLPDDVRQDGYAISNQTTVEKTSTFGTSLNLTPGTYSATVQVLSGNSIVISGTTNVVVVAPTSAPSDSSGGTSPDNSDADGGGLGSLPAPTNLTPEFVMVNWVDPITVKWTNPPTTKYVKFELQSPTSDEGFTIILKSASQYAIRLPRIGVGPYIILPDTEYVWFVSASNAASQPLANSTTFGPPARSSFTTPKATSSGISPVNPINGKTGVPTTGYVQWSHNNPYIFYYDVQIASNPEFAGGIISERKHAGETNPKYSCAYSGLQPGTKHYWRVRAVNTEETAWSTVWTFTTSGTSTSGGVSGGDSGGSDGASVRVSISNLSSNIQPNGRITGTLKITNPTSIARIYDIDLEWGNNNDTSGHFSRSVNVPSGNTVSVAFDVKAPNAAGTYRAYMGIRSGSMILDSNDSPEDSSWNIVVGQAVQQNVPVSGNLSISKSGNSITFNLTNIQGNPDSIEVYAATRNSNTVSGESWKLVSTSTNGTIDLQANDIPGPYVAVAISLIKGGGVVATGVPGQPGYNANLGKVIQVDTITSSVPVGGKLVAGLYGENYDEAQWAISNIVGSPEQINIWANSVANAQAGHSWTKVGSGTSGRFDPRPWGPGTTVIIIAELIKNGSVAATGITGRAGYNGNLSAWVTNKAASASRLDGLTFI